MTPVQLCRCLGDDLRLTLVALIRARQDVCVCELTELLGAPQSTVSRHLSQLRECGIVVARREGTWMHYRLAPDMPPWALECIDRLVDAVDAPTQNWPLSRAC